MVYYQSRRSTQSSQRAAEAAETTPDAAPRSGGRRASYPRSSNHRGRLCGFSGFCVDWLSSLVLIRRGHATSAWLALIPVVLGGLGQSPAQPGARTIAVPSMPLHGDEFVGPFPSWTNVKTAYGAAGDGMADDTAAIQSGLDEVAVSGHSPVLFI